MKKRERERLRAVLDAALQGRMADDVLGVPEDWLLKHMALYGLHEEDVQSLAKLHADCAIRLSAVFRLLRDADTDFDEAVACFTAKSQLKQHHGILLPAALLLRAKEAFGLPEDALVDAMLSLAEQCERSERVIGVALERLCALAEAGRCSTMEEGFALDADRCSEEE